MSPKDKPLARLQGEVRSPPFSEEARICVGFLLRLMQRGEFVGMPRSRPMPSVGARCHELRVPDSNVSWRIMFRIDMDANVIIEIFSKKTGKTPMSIIELGKKRLKDCDSA